jgi:hypothetical protein
MNDDVLKRLHFRELALRYLDSFNPPLKKSIVIADCICSYDGNLNPVAPMRHIAHTFVHGAAKIIENNQLLPADHAFHHWLTEWSKNFWE